MPISAFNFSLQLLLETKSLVPTVVSALTDLIYWPNSALSLPQTLLHELEHISKLGQAKR